MLLIILGKLDHNPESVFGMKLHFLQPTMLHPADYPQALGLDRKVNDPWSQLFPTVGSRIVINLEEKLQPLRALPATFRGQVERVFSFVDAG